MEISYLANSNPQLPNLRHKRVLVVNNNFISYEFWTFKENEQLASINKDKFLNSIFISAEKVIEPEKKETRLSKHQNLQMTNSTTILKKYV